MGSRLVALIFAALLGTGLVAAGTRSHALQGPLVQLVARDSAVIRWFTARPARGEVRFGLDPLALTHSVVEAHAGLDHEVRVTGLRGSTTYYYSVHAGDEVSTGTDHYFTTSPSACEPFRFAVFGDSQGEAATCAAAPAWREVARLVDGLRPALVLGTGDYVADGAAPACWERWIEASGGLFRHTPFFPAIGNHDYERQHYTGEDNRGLRNFTRWFALPAGPEPGVATTYYAFTFGNSRFIVYDAYKARAPGSTQLSWLERELDQARRAPDIQHVFVLNHTTFEGVGNFCVPGHPDRNQARNRAWVEPLLERYGVTATFAGHEHTYSHVERNGIHHVVTGGGGGTLENSRESCHQPRCPGTPGLAGYDGCSHHAVLVEVDGAHVRYTVIATDGTRLDTWEDEDRAAGAASCAR